MLGLILTNEEAYEVIKGQMCDAFPPDRKAQMASAFDKLMCVRPDPLPSPPVTTAGDERSMTGGWRSRGGVLMNLESRNRDKFTQNLTAFRTDVKNFLST